MLRPPPQHTAGVYCGPRARRGHGRAPRKEGGLKQASGGYSLPWKPPPTPNSLFKVRIINTDSLFVIVGSDRAERGPAAQATCRQISTFFTEQNLSHNQ